MTLNLAALNEVSRAFALRTEGSPFFSTPAIERVRRSLRAGLAAPSDSVMILVGTAGVGKTLLIQSLLDELPAKGWRKARLSFTLMSGADILRSVAYAFGMPPHETQEAHDMREPIEWLRDRLCDWTAREQKCLLVVDEAQGLSPEALHTLLGLSQMRLNKRPLLRVLLAGQPELLDLLDAPEAEPFALTLFSLPGFLPNESFAYVRECMARYAAPRLPALGDDALAALHQRSQGLPGRLNQLCIRLFHTAILQESFATLDAAAVMAEANDLSFHARPESTPPVIARVARSPRAQLAEASVDLPAAPVQPVDLVAPTSPVITTPSKRLPASLLASLCLGLLACGVLFYAARLPDAQLPDKALAQTRPVPVIEQAGAEPTADAGELLIHPAAGPQRAPETAAPAAPPVIRQGGTPLPAKDEATTHKLCEKLLVQVSLGEPLSTAQKRTLETQCH